MIESVQKLEILVRLRMNQFEVQKMLKAWARRHDADVKPMGRLVRPFKTEGENMHWHIVDSGKEWEPLRSLTYLRVEGLRS